jgi:hypothetical protein
MKQQKNVRYVKNKVDYVMRSGMEAEQLAVKHVGQAGHRMPIGDNCRPEGPQHTRWRQTLLNMGVFGNVRRIVIVDEWIPAQRPEYNRCDQDQRKTNNQLATHFARFQRLQAIAARQRRQWIFS